MDVVKFADAPFYYRPNYEVVIARRLQGDVANSADIAWVGSSDFPLGVIVPMKAGPDRQDLCRDAWRSDCRARRWSAAPS